MQKKFYPPAKRVEMFEITDTGDARLMATCPVCRAAWFYATEIVVCTLLGAKNINGEPLAPEPVEMVCDKCIKYANGLMDGFYIYILYRRGHLAAADLLVGALAGQNRIVPDHKLVTPMEVWELLVDVADADHTHVYYEGEWDDIWKALNEPHKLAA